MKKTVQQQFLHKFYMATFCSLLNENAGFVNLDSINQINFNSKNLLEL